MRKRRGSALIFALAIISLITLTAVAFSAIAYNSLTLSASSTNGIRAFHIAEAGIARTYMELRSGTYDGLAVGVYTTSSGTFELATGDSGSYSVTVTRQADIYRDPSDPTNPFFSYKLESTGTHDGVARQVTLEAEQVSFTRYSYFTTDEDTQWWFGWEFPVWFITGDVVYGPLHTNDRLYIYGEEDVAGPTFDGPVSISNARGTLVDPWTGRLYTQPIEYYHGGPPLDNPVFNQGLTLNAPDITFPSTSETDAQAVLSRVKTAAQQAGGTYLRGDSDIALLPDGTMDVTYNDTSLSPPQWVTQNMPIPANCAIFVDSNPNDVDPDTADGDVNIFGILNGRLSVATTQDIVITDDILYNDDPITNPNSQDMLALVGDNIILHHDAAPQGGNVEIDAYILALDTSFTVSRFDWYWDAYYNKGTMTVLGGITQVRRGAVGVFNGSTGEKLSGYEKCYIYDDRLADKCPPYFPKARDSHGIVYVRAKWCEEI